MLPCYCATTFKVTVLSLAFETAHTAATEALDPSQKVNGSGVLVFYPGSFMAKANGSQARAASLVRHLAETRSDVTVYSYPNVGEPWTERDVEAFRQCYPSAQLVLEDEGWGLRWAKLVKKALVQLFPGSSAKVLSKEFGGCAPKLSQWKRNHPDGVFLVNYLDNVPRLNGVAPERTIIETHDFQYFRRSKGAVSMLWSVRGLLRLRHEVATLSAVGGIVAISRTEEYVYRNLAPRSRVFFIPLYERVTGITLAAPTSHYQYDLLFVGSANKVNELGLLRFVRDCSWLRQYRIAVCGKICELESIRTLAEGENNLKLLGFQADLSSVYQTAMACICPTHGTGLNIKILEALSFGKPVFASRDAMDALPGGFEACVLPLDSAKVDGLLTNSSALEAAGRAAIEYYRRIPESGDIRSLDAHLSHVSARGIVEAGR